MQRSTTAHPTIHFQECPNFNLQFIDTPGLSDSSKKDAEIKADINKFLDCHKPNCVILFYRFGAEMTGVSFVYFSFNFILSLTSKSSLLTQFCLLVRLQQSINVRS